MKEDRHYTSTSALFGKTGERFTAKEVEKIVTEYNNSHNDGSRLYYDKEGNVNYQEEIKPQLLPGNI